MTDRKVIRQLAATRDIVEYAVYRAIRSPQASERFLDSVEVTISQLAKRPGIGASVECVRPELAGLRCSPILRFKNHLIFYLSREDGIEVVRIRHGATDIESLFESDEDEGPDPP